ncbi:hypothetical protein PN499_24165 [Kamptonema animale CS-326]|uniref:hypothetical protein n=1 Tax=Kamptonema animale TaxID=92934 RepID=UPI002330E0DD|nr:hypothetical protein [Kamptonema animale]MDB9514300.1 hypothetical protein [Kamptonema animale CS-326]
MVGLRYYHNDTSQGLIKLRADLRLILLNVEDLALIYYALVSLGWGMGAVLSCWGSEGDRSSVGWVRKI